MTILYSTHHHWQPASHDLELLSRPHSIRDRYRVRYGVVLVAPSRSGDGVRPGILLHLLFVDTGRTSGRENKNTIKNTGSANLYTPYVAYLHTFNCAVSLAHSAFNLCLRYMQAEWANVRVITQRTDLRF